MIYVQILHALREIILILRLINAKNALQDVYRALMEQHVMFVCQEQFGLKVLQHVKIVYQQLVLNLLMDNA